MISLRRLALGGGLAVFVYFAYACAAGTDDARGGFDDADGGGTKDGGKEGSTIRIEDSGGPEPEEDSGGPKCTGKVVINELMTDGVGSAASEEFVELYNPNGCAISMTGWKIAYRAASGNPSSTGLHTFAAGTQIPSKGFFVLGGDAFKGKVDGSLTNSMAATQGQVALVDDQGDVVDGVAYGTGIMVDAGAGTYAEKTPAQAPLEGASISRKTDGHDTDDNAADFVRTSPHSAGAPN